MNPSEHIDDLHDQGELGFMHGAALDDPDTLFNGELNGNQRRSVEFSERDPIAEGPLANLVRAAIDHNRKR
jgi:hypothetical protein